MSAKRTIRKILFAALWLAIGGGMLTLLIAAMGKQKKELCSNYEISIRATSSDNFFLDESEILQLLKSTAHGNIKGQPKSAFNLQRMEQLLEDNVWIKDAQLYFDNQAVLHVAVEEREPVARLFTATGRSFYIDETGRSLPLSDNMIAKVPVFTGFPETLTKADSTVLTAIDTIAQYINSHPFWAAQVAQVDMVADCGPCCWEFELVPVIGRHLIKLGNGEQIPQKFQRLLAFYQQVLSRTGFDRYKTIDARFAGQVIGSKSENPKIDSVQVRKNVELLLQQANEANRDTIAAGQPISNQAQVNRPAANATVVTGTQDNNPATVSRPKPADRQRDDPKPPKPAATEGDRRPRAVMPGRNE